MLDKDLLSLAQDISQGNPGALRVFMELIDAYGMLAAIDFGILLEAQIIGSELWMLYKDICKCNIHETHKAIITHTAVEKLRGDRWSRFYQGDEVSQEVGEIYERAERT